MPDRNTIQRAPDGERVESSEPSTVECIQTVKGKRAWTVIASSFAERRVTV